jgi:hypothetical protein
VAATRRGSKAHHGSRRRRGGGAGVGAGGGRHADRQQVGRGARERGPERVTAEEQAGARGGQARGVVEERVGSEEGEDHGGGGMVGAARL